MNGHISVRRQPYPCCHWIDPTVWSPQPNHFFGNGHLSPNLILTGNAAVNSTEAEFPGEKLYAFVIRIEVSSFPFLPGMRPLLSPHYKQSGVCACACHLAQKFALLEYVCCTEMGASWKTRPTPVSPKVFPSGLGQKMKLSHYILLKHCDLATAFGLSRACPSAPISHPDGPT